MSDIKESDWKLFRGFHPIALARFCERVLKDSEAIISADGKNHHERYLELYKLVKAKDQELGHIFNDFRRSTAFIQLRQIYLLSLLTEEEISQFSPEAQKWMTA